jgi:hypothetical protein
LNFTAAVTLVLINKYTVILATNRLGRNMKTNKKPTKNTKKNKKKKTSNKTSIKTKMNQDSPE